MALTKSFIARRELTIPITKERRVASSSEFLPIWASESLKQKADRLSSQGSRTLQASDIYSPLPPDLSALTFEPSPATHLGSQWKQQFQDPQDFPGAAGREISPIDQEERRALEEEALAFVEPEEDEESFAVQAMQEPGRYRHEPFDREEWFSRPHEPQFYQEPKNLKDFAWVAEDESFQVDGITNLTNHIGAFSRSFLSSVRGREEKDNTTSQANAISQESIETVNLVLPEPPMDKFRGLDRFEMYDRFKTLVLRLHNERNSNKQEDEKIMKIFLNSIALCGEFDADYIADSLGETVPENANLASHRSYGSYQSRGTVHMEHVPRKTYVPMSAEERRQKLNQYAHSSAEILDKLAADVRSKDRVIEDNGRGIVITVETIRKMSNKELMHWINTRKAAINRQQFLIGGRPAPRLIATFLRTKGKDEQTRILHQMNGGGLFDHPSEPRQSLVGDSDSDDENRGEGFKRRASNASSLRRAPIPKYSHDDTHDSDWDTQLKAYQDGVVHRILNPFFRAKGERVIDPRRQATESKAQASQFAVEGATHLIDGEEVEEYVRGKMPKPPKPWAENTFNAKEDFRKRVAHKDLRESAPKLSLSFVQGHCKSRPGLRAPRVATRSKHVVASHSAPQTRRRTLALALEWDGSGTVLWVTKALSEQEKQWQGRMARTKVMSEEEKRLAKVHAKLAQERRVYTKHHHIKKEDKRYMDVNRYGGLDGKTVEPMFNCSSRIPYLNQFNNYAVVTKKHS